LLAEEARIPLDFTYGVIDKCILKALTGKSSMIMTSGGMVSTPSRGSGLLPGVGARIEVVRLLARRIGRKIERADEIGGG